jgi:hypothetical protein
VNDAEALSPSDPLTVMVYVLPVAMFATKKKVPVKAVPPPDKTHADEAKSPPGAEEIAHEAESPPLKRPPVSDIVMVSPGDPVAAESVITGVPSMRKDVLAKSPVFPVTFIVVFVSRATDIPTVNEPVTFPPLTLQL